MPTPTSGTAFSFVPQSGYTIIDALIEGTKWGGPVGTGVSLTYSFPTSSVAFSPTYEGNEPATFHGLNEAPANIVDDIRQTLFTWSAVANVNFVETTDTAANVGDIRFAYASLGPSFSALAFLPYDGPEAGDIWFSWDVGFMKQNGTSDYSNRVETITHEIGHALGLKHPFEGDVQLPSAVENDLYTVMSYTDNRGPSAFPSQDATPMLYDILAVQYLYGANNSFHNGDDVWTVGRFPQYGPLILSTNGVRVTIWDGGGNDTLVADSGSSVLDLRQGAVSSSGAFGQAVIAFNTVIENATGSGLRDVITGNEVANVLRGMGGADSMTGDAGDDWIEGDSGNDPLPFDGGVQQVAGADNLWGNDGSDTILAGGGDDTVFGGDGVDVLVGEGANDLIYGDAGIDYIDGRQGNDQLFGGDGNDVIFGDGLTTIYGFGGDTIHGNNGDDIIMGESGDHNAPGALDIMYGEDGNDLMYGGSGHDWIFGGNGSDVIDGGSDNDYIVGGPGAEILVGSGDSTNVGGPPVTTGSDLFVYTSMADAGDNIYGFDTRPGDTDGIDLRALFDSIGYAGANARADGFLAVTSGAVPTDAVVWVDASGGGNSFTPLLALHGVNPSTLIDSFFLFQ